MSVVEEQKIKISTCSLDRSDLKEICKLLEDESNIIKQRNKDAYVSLSFELNSKRKNIKTGSADSFLNSRFPKNVENIILWLYVRQDESQEVRVSLDFSFFSEPNFKVEGSNSTWVNGLSKKLENIFEDKKNRNYIFRENKTRIPIVISLAILLGLGVAGLVLSYFPDFYENEDRTPYGLATSIAVFTAFPLFMSTIWLFPIVEFENYQIQTRIKKIILSGLGALIIGMIVLAISKLWF